MVNDSSERLSNVFAALSDPTRRGMLAYLARHGEASIGVLGEPYDMSAPAVTKHIRVLEQAGLIEREIDGRIHRCRLSGKRLDEAARWIESTRHFWEARFDALARHLERNPE